MTAKNRYARRSKISEAKFRKLVNFFALRIGGHPDRRVGQPEPQHRKSFPRKAIRGRLAEHSEQQSPFAGEVEVDESFFGARHVKGKRGRGASGKTIVFGVFKRNGKVYTEIVPDCSKATLQAVIRGKVEPESVIYSDNSHGYNGLVDVGYGKHLRVDHGRNEFAKGKTHINGIEGFWGFGKARLARFRRMRKATFYLHLKECEFRFNSRGDNLYRTILKMVQEEASVLVMTLI